MLIDLIEGRGELVQSIDWNQTRSYSLYFFHPLERLKSRRKRPCNRGRMKKKKKKKKDQKRCFHFKSELRANYESKLLLACSCPLNIVLAMNPNNSLQAFIICSEQLPSRMSCNMRTKASSMTWKKVENAFPTKRFSVNVSHKDLVLYLLY